MAVSKALKLFDSLIKPIFSYAVEFWLPFIIPKKGFDDPASFLKVWESFRPEILNQKVCRLLLSVHKRCSRLAVLGELGRYPVLLPALKQCLKYQYQIDRTNTSSLLHSAMSDMKNNPQVDTWYTRVEKIKSLLSIKKLYGKPDKAGMAFDKKLKVNLIDFSLIKLTKQR